MIAVVAEDLKFPLRVIVILEPLNETIAGVEMADLLGIFTLIVVNVVNAQEHRFRFTATDADVTAVCRISRFFQNGVVLALVRCLARLFGFIPSRRLRNPLFPVLGVILIPPFAGAFAVTLFPVLIGAVHALAACVSPIARLTLSETR